MLEVISIQYSLYHFPGSKIQQNYDKKQSDESKSEYIYTATFTNIMILCCKHIDVSVYTTFNRIHLLSINDRR